MPLSGYTADAILKLKACLEAVQDKSTPLWQLTPTENGVCSLDMVDILFRIELAFTQNISARTDRHDSFTFDVEELTVDQILSLWDDIIQLLD